MPAVAIAQLPSPRPSPAGRRGTSRARAKHTPRNRLPDPMPGPYCRNRGRGRKRCRKHPRSSLATVAAARRVKPAFSTSRTLRGCGYVAKSILANLQMPKIFISYSHDSNKHKEAVKLLAEELRAAGCKVAIDQNDEPETGWYSWCESQIIKSDYIVMVCTKFYFNKVYSEDTLPSGVKFEGYCIRASLYKNGMVNTKLIPVVLDEESAIFIPIFACSYGYYELFREDSKQKFIDKIINPRAIRPSIDQDMDEEKFSQFEKHIDLWNRLKPKMPQSVYENALGRMTNSFLDGLGYKK